MRSSTSAWASGDQINSFQNIVQHVGALNQEINIWNTTNKVVVANRALVVWIARFGPNISMEPVYLHYDFDSKIWYYQHCMDNSDLDDVLWAKCRFTPIYTIDCVEIMSFFKINSNPKCHYLEILGWIEWLILVFLVFYCLFLFIKLIFTWYNMFYTKFIG